MRNTGILLILAGIYVIWNSGSFRDVTLGKATLSFKDPTEKKTKAKEKQDNKVTYDA